MGLREGLCVTDTVLHKEGVPETDFLGLKDTDGDELGEADFDAEGVEIPLALEEMVEQLVTVMVPQLLPVSEGVLEPEADGQGEALRELTEEPLNAIAVLERVGVEIALTEYDPVSLLELESVLDSLAPSVKLCVGVGSPEGV